MKNLKKIIQIFYLLVGMFLLILIIQFIKKYQKIISWLIKIFHSWIKIGKRPWRLIIHILKIYKTDFINDYRFLNIKFFAEEINMNYKLF